MSKALTKCSALLDTSNFIHADECFTDGRKLYINEYGINAFVGVSGSALLTCYIESDMEVEKEMQNIKPPQPIQMDEDTPFRGVLQKHKTSSLKRVYIG